RNNDSRQHKFICRVKGRATHGIMGEVCGVRDGKAEGGKPVLPGQRVIPHQFITAMQVFFRVTVLVPDPVKTYRKIGPEDEGQIMGLKKRDQQGWNTGSGLNAYPPVVVVLQRLVWGYLKRTGSLDR